MSTSGKRRFARIDRLPLYVFNITAELKMAARRRGEDIIDMSMGNPDGATPAHKVFHAYAEQSAAGIKSAIRLKLMRIQKRLLRSVLKKGWRI
jgi:hypothetical protein